MLSSPQHGVDHLKVDKPRLGAQIIRISWWLMTVFR